MNATKKNDFKLKSKNENKLIIVSGLFGCIMFFIWFVFFVDRVFINNSIIIFLLFVPSIVVSGILYIVKDLIRISNSRLKKNIRSSFSLFEFISVTLAVGNFIVAAFLICNSIFAEKEIKEVKLEPFNIGLSHTKHFNHVSHLEVTYDNITKELAFGDRPLNTMHGKSLNMKVSKGFFGFYIIRGRRLE